MRRAFGGKVSREGYTTTATSAGTTTLTASSNVNQFFTGTTSHTVNLPDATTLSLGWRVRICNRSDGTTSSGFILVKNSSGTTLATLTAGSEMTFYCTSIGSAAGTWDTGHGLQFRSGFRTTVTAAATTAFTFAEPPVRRFTGTTTQNVTLPDCTTLWVGWKVRILNTSTGNVTIKDTAASTQATLTQNTEVVLTCLAITSSAGTWQRDLLPLSVVDQAYVTANNPTISNPTFTNPTVVLPIGSTANQIITALQTLGLVSEI